MYERMSPGVYRNGATGQTMRPQGGVMPRQQPVGQRQPTPWARPMQAPQQPNMQQQALDSAYGQLGSAQRQRMPNYGPVQPAQPMGPMPGGFGSAPMTQYQPQGGQMWPQSGGMNMPKQMPGQPMQKQPPIYPDPTRGAY